MARRSTRRGGAPDEDTAAATDPYDYDTPPDPAPKRSRRPRSGAGGRWWVWVGRAVLWAFIIVVLFNGIWMPLRDGIAQPTDDRPAAEEEPAFPESAAAAFATRFAETYLNTAEGEGQDRADSLAAFVPEGRATAFNVDGSLTGRDISLVTVDVRDDNNAVVTLTADVNGQPMSLDVPVYADGPSSLVVSGQPALLAAPGRAELPGTASVENDTDARDELTPRLEGFFGAYAEDPDYLSSFLEPGAGISPLPEGTLEFAELDELTVPVRAAGEDDVRQAMATVVWRLSGGDEDSRADLTQSYLLTVVKDGENWYVRDIQGAPQSFGE
ncbi:conjugal transfer protein [Nocardiopsis sediminis]|uniref:Conjugal transfer protein n=1 Tax=Nocardiopsis sediminis TaxID=1778267 RepID=A0ABV8FR68_9ACTN